MQREAARGAGLAVIEHEAVGDEASIFLASELEGLTLGDALEGREFFVAHAEELLLGELAGGLFDVRSLDGVGTVEVGDIGGAMRELNQISQHTPTGASEPVASLL